MDYSKLLILAGVIGAVFGIMSLFENDIVRLIRKILKKEKTENK